MISSILTTTGILTKRETATMKLILDTDIGIVQEMLCALNVAH